MNLLPFFFPLLFWLLHGFALLPESSGVSGGLLGRAILLLLALLVLLLPVCWLSARSALKAYGLLVPLVVGETYTLWRTGSLLSVGVAHALWSTHWGEAWQYFSAQGELGGGVFALLLAGVLPVLIWRISARLPKGKYSSKKLALAVTLSLLAMLLGLVLREGRMVGHQGIDNVQPALERQLHRTVPVGTLWKLYTAYALEAEIAKSYASIEENARKLFVQPLDSLPRLVVLFIGESSRRDHWQLFGYTRPTNPKLMARQGLVRFDSVVAPATFTWQAVPLMLNRATVENPAGLQSEPNILAYARKAGYRVTWISNQALDDSPLLQLQLKQADSVILVGQDITKDGGYDSRLLEEFARLPAHDRELVVLHGIGQHQRYDYRYPASFDFFQPSLKGSSLMPAQDKSLQDLVFNSYDNAIRYTDWVLDSLISMLSKDKKRPGHLMFVSDHGEALYEGPDALLGHGYAEAMDAQTRIPLLLWSQGESLPSEQECSAREAVSSDYTFETLMDLLHIESPGVQMEPSLLRGGCKLPKTVAKPSDLLWQE